MTAVMRSVLFISSIVSAVLMPAGVRAQDPQAGAEEKQQERTTGLPTAMKWTFNFDAGWGTFGFANSLFDNPKEPGVEEAFFQGDDPDTASNEAFEPLFPGFYDWGTWWQGEIAGEYLAYGMVYVGYSF
jgi:hypothetical protein